MAPAHRHATGVAVYPALFLFGQQLQLEEQNFIHSKLSEKPQLKLLHSDNKAGNDPPSEALIAPIVLYLAQISSEISRDSSFGLGKCQIYAQI